MVLRDLRPLFVPTLAAVVPPYHSGAIHLLQAMTSKEAECPPIQMEPVDLSVNKKTSNPSSPTLSAKLVNLSLPSPASSPPSASSWLQGSRHLHPTGDDTSSSADEHSPLSMDMVQRAGSPAYLSLQRIKQASLKDLSDEQIGYYFTRKQFSTSALLSCFFHTKMIFSKDIS